MALLEQMRIEEWEYDHDTAYGRVDCVGIYRYTMYWYYSASSVKALKISTHVEGTYRNSVYNKTDPKKTLLVKGKSTQTLSLELEWACFVIHLAMMGTLQYMLVTISPDMRMLLLNLYMVA